MCSAGVHNAASSGPVSLFHMPCLNSFITHSATGWLRSCQMIGKLWEWSVPICGFVLFYGVFLFPPVVLGQIRSAIGSSQLLMKQKLRQYIGLVDSAQTQSGHRRTTAEDLQVGGRQLEGGNTLKSLVCFSLCTVGTGGINFWPFHAMFLAGFLGHGVPPGREPFQDVLRPGGAGEEQLGDNSTFSKETQSHGRPC